MKLLCLLSGGIDSPVAAARMLKLGHEVAFIHFHSATAGAHGATSKVLQLIQALADRFDKPLTAYLVPFLPIQLELIKHIPSKWRMLAYRRMMFKIAATIAKQNGYEAFVTGDNLAQVASQTLENLNVIYTAADPDLPVLTPILGNDKVETINEAKKLGTYELSILPYEDCCSFLIAKHPATKAHPEQLEALEAKLDITKLVQQAAATAHKTTLSPKPLAKEL